MYNGTHDTILFCIGTFDRYHLMLKKECNEKREPTTTNYFFCVSYNVLSLFRFRVMFFRLLKFCHIVIWRQNGGWFTIKHRSTQNQRRISFSYYWDVGDYVMIGIWARIMYLMKLKHLYEGWREYWCIPRT